MPLLLHKIQRFSYLSPEAQNHVVAKGEVRELGDEEVLFREGELGARIHFLLSGMVKLTSYLPDGHEVLIDLLAPGDAAGEAAVLGDLPHFTTAQAKGEAVVFSIDKTHYLELIRSQPGQLESHLSHAASDAMRITRRLGEALGGNVPKRLAYLLLMLEERFGNHANPVVDLRLSRRELAEMTGMRQETAIRALRVMEKRKILAFEANGFQILRRNCLEFVAYLGCDCDRGCPAEKQIA